MSEPAFHQDKPKFPTDPGLYPRIPDDQYHRWPYAAQSILKILRDQTPAHAKQAMDHPSEPTPALRLGSAVHMAFLQPELFSSSYVSAPSVDRRTKEGKAAWESFIQENVGRTVLTAGEMAQCLAVRESVAAHPTARKLLEGDAELSAIWQDSDTGVWCKGRFDKVSRGIGAITDLKTTRDASPRSFTRSIWSYGYYIQAAHYLQGARALGIPAEFFTIIAVEKEPPYCVAVYHIRGEAVEAGLRELKPLLEIYAHCEESGVWPGFPPEAVEIDLPRYAYFELESEEIA